ncbi:MAG: hypothetical protein KL787_05680 [Taibaiella sp.]|nr:hypothetical protein [Taibaiella sp.]
MKYILFVLLLFVTKANAQVLSTIRDKYLFISVEMLPEANDSASIKVDIKVKEDILILDGIGCF